ncbi:protein phosphatase 2c (macronuclear) [Tetrahymena thermophila SB210]|uniref:protein-serine/threonine phosphatase n=1 Tax=Tetrahymena thermophila (strain SB210) TaxID=312017 RepID=Q23EC3_TETTS|nr:protein phosphatase 2c [Tetrahymena thermophila SB210]EAR94830.2 protein phosphatase 2c [Tetrahymena thermophila SB210]|eukprot:XP_001015075.2 protein phosphatase 2c [Tetrahymena thermophila SB210]
MNIKKTYTVVNYFESKNTQQQQISKRSLFNHTLLCTSGIYKNKSINLSTDGEVFGSGTDKNISMIIHQANLAEIHSYFEYDASLDTFSLIHVGGNTFYSPFTQQFRQLLSTINKNTYMIEGHLFKIEQGSQIKAIEAFKKIHKDSIFIKNYMFEQDSKLSDLKDFLIKKLQEKYDDKSFYCELDLLIKSIDIVINSNYNFEYNLKFEDKILGDITVDWLGISINNKYQIIQNIDNLIFQQQIIQNKINSQTSNELINNSSQLQENSQSLVFSNLSISVIDQDLSDQESQNNNQFVKTDLQNFIKIQIAQNKNHKVIKLENITNQMRQLIKKQLLLQVNLVDDEIELISQNNLLYMQINQQNTPIRLNSQDHIQLGDLKFVYQRFNLGQISDQGTRKNNEDGILIIENLQISKEYKSSLLCVIDGQGGNKCTKFIIDNLEKIIKDQFKSCQIEFNDEYFNQKVVDNLKQIIFELDLKFLNKYPNVSKLCGATIALSLILGNRLFTGWLGDCQSLIFSESKIIRLTNDHIPSRQDEVNRIENSGGFIQDDRLQGTVTISRCLGQFEYKNIDEYQQKKFYPTNKICDLKSLISSELEITVYDIDNSRDKFLCNFTDGIIDKMSINEIVSFIESSVSNQRSPQQICQDLINQASKLSEKRDNMSLILLQFD